MGKTKTFVVEGVTEDTKSGKDAYAEKMAKRAAQEASLNDAKPQEKGGETEQKVDKNSKKSKKEEKNQVKGVGLKGGERIKVIGGEVTEEVTETTEKEADSGTQKTQRKLKVRGKNYKSAYAKVNKEKLYKLPDGLKLLRDIKFSKFDETVEVHITTKSSPINVNATLPHSTGKQKVVEIATEATIEKLKSGKVDFDVLVATVDMMPKLVPFAKVLGPKGLMPNPKNGTLIKSAKEAEKFGGNSVNIRTQKDANAIHTVAGKLSMKDTELTENIKTIVDAIGDKQVVKLFLKSTMSPSIKVSL